MLISSMISTTVSFFANSSSNPTAVWFRLLQVFRVFRLVSTIPLIKSIFSTIQYILPQVAPLFWVYFFTIYIYALFGMHLFAFIKPQKTLNGYDLHFKNFTSSLFTLFRVSSGEQWFFIIADIVRNRQPNFVCVSVTNLTEYEEHGLNGCGSYWGYLYFFSFHLIVSVIIFNLFIAVLLGLIKTQNTAVSKYQLAQIKDLWTVYDRKGYGFIDYKNFWQFTSRIAMIYGVKKDDLLDPNQKKNFLKFLALPICIHRQRHISIFGFRFHDVVVKMTQISLFLKYGLLPGGQEQSAQELKQFYKELDSATKFKSEESSLLSGDIAIIILIQRRIKRWIHRGKHLRNLKLRSLGCYNVVLEQFKNNDYSDIITQSAENQQQKKPLQIDNCSSIALNEAAKNNLLKQLNKQGQIQELENQHAYFEDANDNIDDSADDNKPIDEKANDFNIKLEKFNDDLQNVNYLQNNADPANITIAKAHLQEGVQQGQQYQHVRTFNHKILSNILANMRKSSEIDSKQGSV